MSGLELRETAVRVEIRAGAKFDGSALRELIQYRDLLWILARRDIQVRYRQTVLGVAWALIPPVVTASVFAFVLGRVAHVPSDGVPYLLFAFSGLVPWQFFAVALSQSGNSLVTNQSLITKVYLPRMIVPLAAIVACTPDLGISLALLVAMIVQSRLSVGQSILALPPLLALLATFLVAAGLLTSALNVEYRDVRHAMPVLIQLWMFLTPVLYPSTIVPDAWQWVLGLNPMATVVDGFRWALFGTPPPSVTRSLLSTGVALSALAIGVFWFRRTERYFADTV